MHDTFRSELCSLRLVELGTLKTCIAVVNRFVVNLRGFLPRNLGFRWQLLVYVVRSIWNLRMFDLFTLELHKVLKLDHNRYKRLPLRLVKASAVQVLDSKSSEHLKIR